MKIKFLRQGDTCVLFINNWWLAVTPKKSPLFLSQPMFKKKYIGRYFKLGTVSRRIA